MATKTITIPDLGNLEGYRTYITLGVGVLVQVLALFDIGVTQETANTVLSFVVLVAGFFIRKGIKSDTQKAAAEQTANIKEQIVQAAQKSPAE